MEGESNEAGLRIERAVVPRALAAAATGAIDEQRAKVVGDAREKRRHEVGGIAVIALQKDDWATFAAIDHVQRGVLHVDEPAVEIHARVARRGAPQEEQNSRRSAERDDYTQYPSRHRLPPRKR